MSKKKHVKEKKLLFPRVSMLDRLMFTKHLSIMVKAGVPLLESLETLATDSDSDYLKQILTHVANDVNNGKTLSEGFSRYPKVFDTFYISLIKVSEESGTLDENLIFLSKQLAKDYELRQKIKGAMFYPGIVFTAGGGIGGLIAFFILPQMVDFFDSFDVELPLPTKILLFFANIMKGYGVFIVIGAVLLLILLKMAIQRPAIKPYWHKLLLKLPVLGKLTVFGQTARFCRNFATLIASGVPIPESLETASNTLTNVIYQRHLLSAKSALIKGQNISEYLDRKKYKEIPALLVKMLRVGEKTGNLEDVLTYLSEFYEEEIDNITKDLTTILEPIMLIGIGLAVGFVALAIIGPIYKLTGSVY